MWHGSSFPAGFHSLSILGKQNLGGVCHRAVCLAPASWSTDFEKRLHLDVQSSGAGAGGVLGFSLTPFGMGHSKRWPWLNSPPIRVACAVAVAAEHLGLGYRLLIHRPYYCRAFDDAKLSVHPDQKGYEKTDSCIAAAYSLDAGVQGVASFALLLPGMMIVAYRE